MNKVVFEGKTYVKASVLARELGYTTDYVGQLCRAGKVECQLVGRSWYVEEDSLRTHKSNRYRSVKTKSKKTIREKIVDTPSTVSHFYQHTPTKSGTTVQYDLDDAELLPTLKKEPKETKVNVPVELADARAVKISSKSPTYNFETPVRQDIKFYGTLRVSNVQDDDEIVTESLQSEGILAVKAETDDALLSVPISKIAPSKSTHTKKLLKNSNGVISMSQKKKIVGSQRADMEASVANLNQNEDIQEEYRGGGMIITITTLASLVLLVVFVGLETQIQTTSQATIVSYSFAIKNISALLYIAI